MQGRASEAGSLTRIAAADVERVVIDALRDVWAERAAVNAQPIGTGPASQEDAELVEHLVDRAVVSRSGVKLILLPARSGAEDGTDEDTEAPQIVTVAWPLPQAQSRREIVLPAGTDEAPLRPMRSDTHKTLLTAVAKARAWMQDLTSGKVADTNEIAAREGKSERYVRMVLPLAFLAPDVVEIAASHQLPEGWGVSELLADLPASWSEQRSALGLPPTG